MKTSYIVSFFVSVSALLLSSGCVATHEDGRLVLSLGTAMNGMETRSGVLDHSSVMVHNPYPEYQMQVKVAVGKVSPLGYSPMRWTEYDPMPAGANVSARPPSMVVGQEAVLVGIEWFRPDGSSAGKASQVLYGLGSGTQAWHVQVTRRIGEFDRYALNWYHI